MALNENALTLLATLKEELNISGSGDDSQLERYINEASAFCATYCNRKFERATITDEKHTGRGGEKLVLERRPINSANVAAMTIKYNGTTVTATDNIEIHDADAGILYYSLGWYGMSNYLPGVASYFAARTERALWQITYDGGYVTPNQAASGGTYDGDTITLPADLEGACIRLAMFFWKRRNTNAALSTQTIGDASEGYAPIYSKALTELPGFPPEVVTVLNRYADVVI